MIYFNKDSLLLADLKKKCENINISSINCTCQFLHRI